MVKNKSKQKKKTEQFGKRLYQETENPPMFGYELSVDKKTKNKMIKFTKDKHIPIEMMEDVIKSCKKANLKNGQMQIGILIQIPNIFAKKKMKKVFGIKKKGTVVAKKTTIKPRKKSIKW